MTHFISHRAFSSLKRTTLSVAIVTASITIVYPSLALAEEVDTELANRIAVLERKLEIQQDDAEAAKKANATVSAGTGGFRLSNSTSDVNLRIRGILQTDARIFLNDAFDYDKPTKRGGINDTFLLRRAQLDIRGSLGELIDFRIQPEFNGSNSQGDSANLRDGYIDVKFSPYATLRAGKHKAPLSLERLQAAAANSFNELGLAAELAPNRDIGAQLYGDALDKRIEYAVGIYNGAPDGRDTTLLDDSKKTIAGRIFFSPFADDYGILRGLGFGIAGSKGKNELRSDTAQSTANLQATTGRYRSTGQQTIFSYNDATTASGSTAATNAVIAGDHTRLIPQLSYYYNSFGLLGEYAVSKQSLSRSSVSNTAIVNKAELQHKAHTINVSYVLTGEDATYGALKPRNPFKLKGAGWGAVELTARTSQLDFDDKAFINVGSTTDTSFANPNRSVSKAISNGVGVNWWLSQNLKVTADYNQTQFKGGLKGTDGKTTDRKPEHALFVRATLAF